MNPGVFSLMAMMVAASLFVTGWGTRYTEESRLRVPHWVFLLISTGFLGSFDILIDGISINFGTVFIALLMGVYIETIKKIRERLHFLFAATTSAACCFVLMTMVPHDPAFYLMDEQYLYPIISVLSAYLFSREPLFCLNASVSGTLLAGVIHDNRLSSITGVINLGGSELMDLVTSSMIVSFIVDQFVHATGYVFTRLNRRQEGNLEGDPT